MGTLERPSPEGAMSTDDAFIRQRPANNKEMSQ